MLLYTISDLLNNASQQTLNHRNLWVRLPTISMWLGIVVQQDRIKNSSKPTLCQLITMLVGLDLQLPTCCQFSKTVCDIKFTDIVSKEYITKSMQYHFTGRAAKQMMGTICSNYWSGKVLVNLADPPKFYNYPPEFLPVIYYIKSSYYS